LDRVWETLYDKLHIVRNSEKFRNFYSKYLTPKQRGTIWQILGSNSAGFNKEFYQMLSKKGDKVGLLVEKRTEIERKGKPEHDSDYLRVKMEYNLMVMDPGVSREDSIQIINNDLPRTFCQTEFF
jgi:hypothetical protein